MTNEKSLRGRKAQKDGMQCELAIEKLSTEYLEKGYGFIKKRYEPFTRVGKPLSGYRFIGVHLGVSGADFELFFSNGKSGLLELKKRTGNSITFDSLNEMQHRELQTMVDWGFLSFVLVYLLSSGTDENGTWYLIPYAQFNHQKKKSLNCSELEPFMVPCDPTTKLPLLYEKIFNVDVLTTQKENVNE